MSGYRVGGGFDSHQLVTGRPLLLGGVPIANDRGLLGHSDGDCVIHAVCDALLGAASAGDMGVHFPSSDERWKDMSSIVFLEEVGRIVRMRGYAIENVDVTAIAQEPKLAPYLSSMRDRLSQTLAIDAERVSVKAKSADGLGAVGRGEGIAALATVLLRQKKRERP
jgi:2-C-methyl-D-erythritol 2,4-cyclodiphosphate synthase